MVIILVIRCTFSSPIPHTQPPSTGHQQVQLSSHYDTDAFDSMAVVNSEAWSEGGPDEKKLTRSDLLPHVGRSSPVSMRPDPNFIVCKINYRQRLGNEASCDRYDFFPCATHTRPTFSLALFSGCLGGRKCFPPPMWPSN